MSHTHFAPILSRLTYLPAARPDMEWVRDLEDRVTGAVGAAVRKAVETRMVCARTTESGIAAKTAGPGSATAAL